MSDSYRVALVKEVMSVKNILSREELCKMLGYPGTSTNTLVEFEKASDQSEQFSLRFSQYISGLHPDALARLPSLRNVFPHLTPKQEIGKNDLLEPKKQTKQFEDKFSKNKDWLSLKPATQKWVLRNIYPVPSVTSSSTLSDIEKAATEWVHEQKASVIVAHGDKPIGGNSLLIRAMMNCRPAQYLFLFQVGSPDYCALSSDQIKWALIFLGYMNVLIVGSEFQESGVASIVKQMQDFGTHSTHDFGMLLFGSDKVRAHEMAVEVFYCVQGVNVVYDPVPCWLLEDFRRLP